MTKILFLLMTQSTLFRLTKPITVRPLKAVIAFIGENVLNILVKPNNDTSHGHG